MARLKRKAPVKKKDPVDGATNLSPKEWIKEGIQVLVQEGIEQVKVESLAQRLGVTKGSFYWHFADRNALLAAMAAQWKDDSTRWFINLLASLRGSPLSRIHRLFDVMGQINSTIVQHAFRRWGNIDPEIAELVRESDARRQLILAGLIEELGYSAEEARFRAEVLYFWAIGEIAAGDNLDNAAERVRKAKELLRILIASGRRKSRGKVQDRDRPVPSERG
jgi:AcrR family transcriptional regulator